MTAPDELLQPPIRPMTARPALTLPERAELYSFEPKWDGFRCLAFRTADGVVLQSRQMRALTRYFPEVAAAVAQQLPPGSVLDGVIWGRGVGCPPRHRQASRLPRSSLRTASLWSVYDGE